MFEFQNTNIYSFKYKFTIIKGGYYPKEKSTNANSSLLGNDQPFVPFEFKSLGGPLGLILLQ